MDVSSAGQLAAAQIEACINRDRLARCDRATAYLIRELSDELRGQWRGNHSEFCDIDWPHRGTCRCPPPSVLERASEWLADFAKAS